MRKLISLVVVAIVALNASTAEAKRCYRSWSYGWNSQCYSCHNNKAKSYSTDWRDAFSKIAARKSDNEAFNQALSSIVGGTNPQGQVGVAAYGVNPGVASYSGQYSSYPVQGNTLNAVSAINTNPLLDLGALHQQNYKVAQQLSVGAQMAASDTADLTAQAYILENKRQSDIAAYEAIKSISQGAPPQPTIQTFKFQAQVGQNGQVTVQPDQGQQPSIGEPSMSSHDETMSNLGFTPSAIMTTRCARCHAGAQVRGDFDITKELTKEQWVEVARRVDLAPSDPQFMPKADDGKGGFTAGDPLSWEEKTVLGLEALKAQ